MRKLRTYKRRADLLLVDAPIDITFLIVVFIVLFVFNILRVRYAFSTEFPQVSPDSTFFSLMGMAALAGIIFFKMFFARDLKKFLGININYKQWLLYILCPAVYFMIQFFILALSHLTFQVAAGDIYAFYISVAVVEETVYRVLLINVAQYILARAMRAKNEKDMYFINIFCILLSGYVFMKVHTRYIGNTPALLITFFGGCSQAFFYIATKNPMCVILSHALINYAASGSLIQSLNASAVNILEKIKQSVRLKIWTLLLR